MSGYYYRSDLYAAGAAGEGIGTALGAIAFLAPVAPPFLPLGAAVWGTWFGLVNQNHWHPLFGCLACFGTVIAIVWVVYQLFYRVNRILAGILTAIYFMAVYGGCALYVSQQPLEKADPVWASALLLIAAVAGFFIGRYCADEAQKWKRRASVISASQIQAVFDPWEEPTFTSH